MIVKAAGEFKTQGRARSRSYVAALLAATSIGCTITPALAQTISQQSLDGSPIAITSDTIAASAGQGTGISATTAGTIAITSGTVSTTDPASSAIKAAGGTGAVTINSTSASTVGNNAYGIDAATTGGAITITSGSVVTSGSGQVYGISASSGGGNIRIDSTTVSVSGSGSDNNRGINADSGGGDITINAGTTTGYTRAIYTTTLFSGPTLGFTAGTTSITSLDATATGGNAIIAQGQTVNLVSGRAESFANPAFFASTLYVSAGLGGVTMSADETVAHGTGQYGINVLSTGDLVVNSRSVTTDGIDGIGILAAGNKNINVTSGMIATQQSGATAIRLDGYTALGSGGWTVLSDQITTAGARANGIWLSPFDATNSSTGVIAVNSNSLTTTGNSAHGIVVATTGDPGYAVRTASAGAGLGDLAINSKTLSVTGAGARGIVVDHAGSIAIDSGSITANAGGIFVWGRDAVEVTSGQLFTQGGPGIVVYGDSGPVSIDARAVEVGAAGDVGIYAGTSTGNISITAGTVKTNAVAPASGFTADGIIAESSAGGNIKVNAEAVSVKGASAFGIYAATSGLAEVTATKVSTTGTAGTAIYAGGSAGLSVTAGEIGTTGNQAIGIRARSLNGPVSIDVGTVTTSGSNAPAIFVPTSVNGGSVMGGPVSIKAGTVSTSGAGSNGIVVAGSTGTAPGPRTASGGTGALSITADSVSTTGSDAWGVVVDHRGPVALDVGTIKTTGAFGAGLYAWTDGASTFKTGSIEAMNGAGIVIFGAGGDVNVRSGQTASGAGGDVGVFVRTAAGNISINADVTTTSRLDVLNGTITADGVTGISTGGGTVNITAGQTSVKGQSAWGVVASTSGKAEVATGSVRTEGNDGIGIFASGDTGGVLISSGPVTTLGDRAHAISAQATSGAIDINASSPIDMQGTGSIGVLARTGTGGIKVVASDIYAGSSGAQAINLASNGGGTIDLTIAGTIQTSRQSAQDIVQLATSGAARITNNGGVYGAYRPIVVQAGSIQLDNAGQIGTDDGTALSLTSDRISVTNRGGIEAGDRGIAAIGAEFQIANSGSITTAGTAIATNGRATVANTGSIISNGGTALDLSASGTQAITNSGQIIAADVAIRSAGAITLDNAGTITSYNGVAARLSAGADTLVLRTGSSITGTVFGGSGTDTAVLQGNLANRSGNQSFGDLAEFEILRVAQGYWTTAGTSRFDNVGVNAGAVLEIGDAAGAAALGFGGMTNDGQVVLSSTAGLALGSGAVITGSGKLVQAGTGTLTVAGASLVQAGGIDVRNGHLLLSGTLGSNVMTSGSGVFELGQGGTFTGNLVNNGTFLFSQAGDYLFGGDFSGGGTLRKQGAGTLTFGGLYNFTGTTLVSGGKVAFTGALATDTKLDVSGGTLDLSQVAQGTQTVAQLSGTGGAVNLGTTTLTVAQSDNTVFSGTISGSGTLVKTGTGDLKLNGDSTFTGTAQVSGGTLSVNGAMPNATVQVSAGGQLGGNGTVGTTTLNGGILAPGNSIGRLTVNGNIGFNASSVYAVEVNAAGQGDRLDATGSAALGNAAVQVIAAPGNYKALTDYTILAAGGGITGRFGSVTDNLAFLDPFLVYSANSVTLRLVRNDVSFASAAQTPNQTALANLIQGFGYGDPLYNETLMLVAGNAAPSFESLTGDIYPTYGTNLIETADLLRRQSDVTADGANGAFAWGTALTHQVRIGTGAARLSTEGTGVAGGLGIGFGPGSLAIGVGRLGQSARNLQDAGVTFATAQLQLGFARFRFDAIAQLGWAKSRTSRSPSLGTMTQPVSGAIKADYSLVSAQVAYDHAFGAVHAQPFAGLSRIDLGTDGVTETGSATALKIAAGQRVVTMGRMGLRLDWAPLRVGAFASAAYRRAWGDRNGIATVGFVSNPASVRITGTSVARNAAELDAGLNLNLGRLTVEAGYSGVVSPSLQSHGGRVSARFHF